MRITGIQLDAVHVNHRGDWIFLQVDTDEDLHGIGELRAGRDYDGRLKAIRRLERSLIGRDPRRIHALLHELTPVPPTRDMLCALSAVDMALWDLLGKALGAPVYQLLGGSCHNAIRLYANINRATTQRTPDGFAANAVAAVAEGFGAIKLAPFDQMPRAMDSASEAAAGIECMEAVRQAIGPHVELLIDCHSHLTPQGALEVAKALRPLDLFWFEQPVPETDLAVCAQVRRQCGLTVAGGEGRMLRPAFREVLEHGAMDVIMPDVTVVGGISELSKVAAMAEAWDVTTAPHGPFGPLTIAAGAHAMAAQTGFLILEYGWGEIPWRQQLTTPGEQIIQGHLIISDRPGLGLELNTDTVEAHRVALD
jgi:galactonate dehydratase